MSLTRRIAGTLTGATSTRAGEMPSGWVGSTSVSPNSWGSLRLEDGAGQWSASATAYRCVQAIAGNAASLPIQVRQLTDDTNVEAHWLTLLWNQPNPILSRRILAEILWARLETKGQVFVYVDRGDTGNLVTPRALWPLTAQVEPVLASVRADTADQVRVDLLGYIAHVNGRRVNLLPEEVLWLRYPHPENPWQALPPLAAAGHAVELDAYARAWQKGEFRNGAKPKHVVYMGDLDRDAHLEAVRTWRSEVEGAGNAGKSLLLSGPVRAAVDRLSLNPEEMSWLDTRNVSSQEVMLAFGVPKDYLLGGATYENRAASRTTLWSDTIVPKLEVVASEFTRQLLAREPGRRVRFDTDDVDALQEGADARATRTTSLVAHDVVTLDEARAEVGQDPLPNGMGTMTLTAYRALIATSAQAALIGADPGQAARYMQLPIIQTGRATPAPAHGPLLLPSGVRKHGPSKTTILAEYDRHERIIERATGKLAKRQEAVVLTNLDRLMGGRSRASRAWLLRVQAAAAGLPAPLQPDQLTTGTEDEAALRVEAGELFDTGHWRTETRDALEAPIGGAWQAGASGLVSSLGLDFDQFDLLVLTAMDSRLDAFSDQVTATTRQVLEDRVLLQGVANGESIDQLRMRVRSVFADLSSWRATTIARTETVGGFNTASNVVAEASGVVSEREWLATDDTRTRDTHVELDGEVVRGFGSRYPNGLRFPGDPTGRPEEVIQCRCVELYLTED